MVFVQFAYPAHQFQIKASQLFLQLCIRRHSGERLVDIVIGSHNPAACKPAGDLLAKHDGALRAFLIQEEMGCIVRSVVAG